MMIIAIFSTTFPLLWKSRAGTWKPLCVTCHKPIGYTAKEGWYVGRTERRKCRP